MSVAKRIVAKRARVILASRVHSQVTLEVASGGEAFAAHLASIPIQATMEVLMQFQTVVRHKRLVALRATPRLPQFGRQRLRKRRTYCRRTCPDLQVDISRVISSVYPQTTHHYNTVHSKQQVSEAKLREPNNFD